MPNNKCLKIMVLVPLSGTTDDLIIQVWILMMPLNQNWPCNIGARLVSGNLQGTELGGKYGRKGIESQQRQIYNCWYADVYVTGQDGYIISDKIGNKQCHHFYYQSKCVSVISSGSQCWGLGSFMVKVHLDNFGMKQR